MLSFLHSPTFISIHDHWKNHSLDWITFVDKVMSLLFSMLSRLVITFLPETPSYVRTSPGAWRLSIWSRAGWDQGMGKETKCSLYSGCYYARYSCQGKKGSSPKAVSGAPLSSGSCLLPTTFLPFPESGLRCSLQICPCVELLQSCLILCNPMDCSCPWDSPGKNSGVGSHAPLQGIFLTEGSNLLLLPCRRILYH